MKGQRKKKEKVKEKEKEKEMEMNLAGRIEPFASDVYSYHRRLQSAASCRVLPSGESSQLTTEKALGTTRSKVGYRTLNQ